MRNVVQQEIGGYNPALPHSGDFEMWLRAAAVADVGRVNGANQAYYRIHAASMQRTTYAGHLTDLEGRRAAFESVLHSTDRPVADGRRCTSRRRAPWPSMPSTGPAPTTTRGTPLRSRCRT